MKRASVLLLCGLAVFGWAFSGSGASAKTAHTADPADDVYDSGADSRGPGELDVYHAMHVDNGKTITYTLHTVGGFDDDINAIHWYLSTPGVPKDGCAPIDVHVAPEDDHSRAQRIGGIDSAATCTGRNICSGHTGANAETDTHNHQVRGSGSGRDRHTIADRLECRGTRGA